MWEKRYGLVCCQRTDTNRRLYSDAMIERLRLLKDLTACGHRISQIACLCLDELHTLHERELPVAQEPVAPADLPSAPIECCLPRCLEALRQFDTPALTDLLEDSRLRHGQWTTLLRVVAPLVKLVGEAWLRGDLRMGHERLATSVVRDFIAIGRHPHGSDSPEIVVATPSGQAHEMGALLAAAAARGMGWCTTYLGPSVPAEEIVVCAQTREARAVALGLAHPADDPLVLEELRRIRRLLPQHTALIIGGRAAASYHRSLQAPDVKLVCDVADFASILENLTTTA
ncbi:hypothetical protein AYO49_06295 [Verrucomicrobiaceae bacterium SCGC AG-212-N21]|nr:hypothetical protein AYO49_06295 [Verrucomicrobiaceae bacterium SCGC AG-212-N21]